MQRNLFFKCLWATSVGITLWKRGRKNVYKFRCLIHIFLYSSLSLWSFLYYFLILILYRKSIQKWSYKNAVGLPGPINFNFFLAMNYEIDGFKGISFLSCFILLFIDCISGEHGAVETEKLKFQRCLESLEFVDFRSIFSQHFNGVHRCSFIWSLLICW